MKDLNLPETYKNPKITTDSKNGYVLIYGRSIPEYPDKFYQQLSDWVEWYVTKKQPITIDFKIIYLNTGSWRNLLSILIMIEKAEIPYHINWYYEEDDLQLLRAGEDLATLSGLKFDFIEVKEV
ncbi:MAG: hypothetical protein KatS3mg034_0976 [Vicingaceae bacterium]|nr:MAG: hypothetical protein KatS3mg034_0976 [Vicingaceae bacterium]